MGRHEAIWINGIKEPIEYVNFHGTKYIVNGHHRFYAAKGLRIQTVPVKEVTLPHLGYRNSGDLIFEGRFPGWFRHFRF